MTPGDFLDENGNLIGTDGKNDGKTYVVKTTEKSLPAYNDNTGAVENVKTDGISKKDSKAAKDFVKTPPWFVSTNKIKMPRCVSSRTGI